MKLLVINNLASGYGEGAIYDFIRAVATDGDEIVLRSTDGTTDLRTFLTDAGDFDAVVAAGGDGTVATVCYLLANSRIPVLPFPAGTGNLMAINVASPNEPHALAKLLREGRTLDFDLGELDLGGNRYGFGVMAGAGYDATIMTNAEPNKKRWGPAAYFGAALTNALPQRSHISLSIDGKRVEYDGIAVLIANFSKIQFDISVTHMNRPRDGYLDVIMIKAENAIQLLPALGAAVLDRDGNNKRPDTLEYYQAREVHVFADPPLTIQYDGEATKQITPFTVRILPKATRLIVSQEAYEMYMESE